MRPASSHRYILLRAQEASFHVLADDDPLYAAFQEQVLTDPYLASLLLLVDETTTAYVSFNKAVPVPATAANYPAIVLDSAEADTLYDLHGRHQEIPFTLELALGLGNQGQVDLLWAEEHMAKAMGPLLLGLAGLAPVTRHAAPEEVAAPEVALYRGFGLALETIHAQDAIVQTRWRERAQRSDESRVQLARIQQVQDNSYRFIYVDGRPTLHVRSRDDALRTPGVVAALFTRLVQRSTPYYPQRHLLWFFGYPREQIAYAKIMLALHEMHSPRDPSVQEFINSYVKTFPADREMVLALADEILGQAAR